MVERAPVVLDADGVFLDERPYWEVALVVALASAGIEVPAGERSALVAAAVGPLGLPQVAKERGCNSNWELAAVLARALADAPVARSLRTVRGPAALAAWAAAARALRGDALASDPLARFGIARDAEHTVLVARCERELRRVVARGGWPVLGAGGAAALRADLGLLRTAGRQPGICTGRSAGDLDAALQQHGLADVFAAGPRCDADTVDAARQRFGARCTGKPGPFPLLAAVLGAAGAAAVLRGAAADDWPAGLVYVGDSRADLAMATAVRSLGLPLRYAHVVSPATDAGTLAELREAPCVAGVFPLLATFAAQLAGVVA